LNAKNCLCGGETFQKAFEYCSPPPGETTFDFGEQKYKRCYYRCKICGHWHSISQINMTGLYDGQYNDTTYCKNIHKAFDRIISMSPDKSDNAGRIKRIQSFAKAQFPKSKEIRLLDIGSGLGVFPYSVKQIGWHCTALDPDPIAVSHLQDCVKVKSIHGDFMEIDNLDSYDVITFNKVLEHVSDPVAMLDKARGRLADDGFIYIEVPDGEMASIAGKEREEFFIDHLHVFSMASTIFLAERAGLVVLTCERLQEPSSKYTLRAFIVKKESHPKLVQQLRRQQGHDCGGGCGEIRHSIGTTLAI
jgi:2-polyprenyl-3-methyl-5-hydroxy-6-metoxy-1,4-benzoquinol methylase